MHDIKIIIPQYHSNYCINNCKYCGFKNTNSIIPRKRLSFKDFVYELDLIVSWGYRTIEYVFSSDPYFDADEISKRIEYAKEFGNKKGLNLRIGLNSEPFSYLDYKKLYSAGLDFFVIWMETYSQKKYLFWHGKNNIKSDFEYRFTSYNRAIEAGLVNYGIGVLLGLDYWESDVNKLVEHGKKLEKQYNISPYIIGLPRVKKSHSIKINRLISKVNDIEFNNICLIYKKNFPNSMLFFNTRECFNLNIKCCSNKDLFTIDCGTYPGAFMNSDINKMEFEQFRTHYYNREETIKKIEENNFNPQFEW